MAWFCHNFKGFEMFWMAFGWKGFMNGDFSFFEGGGVGRNKAESIVLCRER